MAKIVSLGETMGLITSTNVERLASKSTMVAGFGGAEANCAVALARLGNSVSWIGGVGNDDFAEMIKKGLLGEGINVYAIEKPFPTGLMIKTRPYGDRLNVIYFRKEGAAAHTAPEDIPVDIIKEAELLHFTGISLALSDSSRATSLHALEIARESGAQVSFDMNFRSKLWGESQASKSFRGVVPQVDYLFAGVSEAALAIAGDLVPGDCSESEVHRLLGALREMGAKEPVIKEGVRGAWAFDGDEIIHLPAKKVEVIDSVGAGDGFAAGYLSARLSNQTVQDALELGVKIGAFACLSSGDWEGYPTSDELESLDTFEKVNR